MLRQYVQARMTFVEAPGPYPASPARVRQSAAPLAVRVLRLIVAPFALAAAALAGVLFAVLLPICGIATICEGFTKAAWRFVRESLGQLPHRPAHRI